ncbi:Uncharacterized protein APZ42_023181 [Daphnia magna]|uniref:MULE transposase domain-containing protein n=1 Tax=Daphnia magna TaxID=35525 RepID=A0A164V5Q7_9CRUS|nr:Uncharacterized protein APZ42_023181 [Daphnia magna]
MAEANAARRVRVSVVPGTRKNSFRYNTQFGFIFYKKELRRETLILEYMNRKTGGCHCKISMRNGIYTQTGVHNHEPQFREQHRAAAVQECLAIARTPRMGRQGPKKILELARSVHPEARIALNPALERRIQREKRANQPPPPTTTQEMLESMETHPEFGQTIRGAQFFHGTAHSDEDDEVPGVAFVFLFPILLSQLGESTVVHLDGTFRTVPGLFYQLLTVHVGCFNKAFPLAFVLMTRKTRNLYNAVIRLIIQAYEARFPHAPITIVESWAPSEEFPGFSRGLQTLLQLLVMVIPFLFE